MTTVTLTDEEAQAFLWFREHETMVLDLAAAGLNAMRGGSATIHYTTTGAVASIVLKSVVYKREKPRVNTEQNGVIHRYPQPTRSATPENAV